MTQITLQEIATDPQDFIRRMEDGEPMRVVAGARVVAEIRPVERPSIGGLRPYGLAKGKFVVPDDFDEPLPDDVLADFEGR